MTFKFTFISCQLECWIGVSWPMCSELRLLVQQCVLHSWPNLVPSSKLANHRVSFGHVIALVMYCLPKASRWRIGKRWNWHSVGWDVEANSLACTFRLNKVTIYLLALLNYYVFLWFKYYCVGYHLCTFT